MKYLYTVMDVIAQEVAPPFWANNDGVALRNYQLMVKKEGVQQGDYQLFRIGEISVETGKVVGLDYPERVIATVETAEQQEAAEGY